MRRPSSRPSPPRRAALAAAIATTTAALAAGARAGPATAKVQVLPSLNERHAGLVVTGGERWLRLTARAARTYRKGQIALSCAVVPSDDVADAKNAATAPFEGSLDGVSTIDRIQPRMRIPIPKRMDWCTAIVRGGNDVRSAERKLGEVALNAAGQGHLEERAAVAAMDAAIQTLPLGSAEGPLKPAGITTLLSRIRVLGRRLHAVTLVAPTPTAPIGQLGTWTDGNRLYATATLADGRHLYLDQTPGSNVTSTNVLQTLLELQQDDWPSS